MIILKSIRIRNFRAIKELTFQPRPEGITGIFGQNGAGKSSILTAVLFALYGVTPKGINIGGLRRIDSEGEECSVSVVFEHLGDTVEVIREIKGKNNTVIANVWVNGQEASVTSSATATRWVQKRLGIKAGDFLTAFVVRQKELDAFVRAVPAERKAIIERLAGVEVINDALKEARKDETDAKRNLDLLPGSEENVAEKADEVDYYGDEEQKTNARLLGAQQNAQSLAEEVEKGSEELASLSELRDQWNRASANLERFDPELATIVPQLERLSYVEKLSGMGDVEKLRDEYKTLHEASQQTKDELSDAVATLKGIQRDIQVEELTKQEVKTFIASLKAAAEGEDPAKQIMESRNRIEEYSRTIGRLQDRATDLRESIALLADSPECPTCKTHLEHPETLRTQFESIIQESEEQILVTKQQMAQEETKVATLEARQKAQQDLQEALMEVERATTHINALTEQVGEHEARVKELEKSVQEQDLRLQEVIELGTKARDYASDKATYEQLKERQKKLLAEQREANVLIDELRHKFSLDKFTNLTRQVEDARKRLADSHSVISALASAHTEAELRLEQAKRGYEVANAQWEKKKGLMDAYMKKNLTTDMLESFRKETVSSIAPEMSDYATELISDMTGGDFTEIRLDEDFQAFLTDKDGQERPVQWLSGGEESAVALALRLAVAFLITGGHPSLLWLDEPLTAQDKDRRASILSMIRGLPIDQILIINHAQEAQDIVDDEITLVKD